MRLVPHDYQWEAMRFLYERDGAALFADPGLGKTAITLLLLDLLRLRYGRIKALISAPVRVVHNVWPDEIQKWDNFDFSFTLLHGPKKDARLQEDVEIYIANPEGLKWLTSQARKPDWDVLIVDESSQYKNPSSQRFKLLKELLPSFRRRYLLSGTPTPRSLLDLWSQIFIIDQGARLGKKITHYRNAYFYAERKNKYVVWHLIPGMAKVIHDKCADIAIRLDEKTHLNLPGLVHNDVKVSLPDKIKKMYNKMFRDLYTEINGETVFADSATEKYFICRDIISGARYLEKGLHEYETLHTAKISALAEIIDELQGKPVMVAYTRWHEYFRICERFGDLPVVNGKTSQKKCERIKNRWNEGEISILLVQPQALSHGLNLQKGGHDLVWFSLVEDYEVYEQLQRRLYRQGVFQPVRVHHIIAQGTLDSLILARLHDKRLRQQSLFQAIKLYYNRKKSRIS